MQLNQNFGNWSLVIGHWAIQHKEQKCNDLLEGPPKKKVPNAQFPMPKATFTESAICTASHYYTGDSF